MNDPIDQAAKIKNKIAGFYPRTFSVNMGNKIMTKEAQIQLVAVENGTI